MTLQEASRRFQMKWDVLRRYEESGFLRGKEGDGAVDYPEAEIQRACQLYSLEKAGMDPDALKRFAQLLGSDGDTKEERLRILRKCRCRLLEEIHEKQQGLDRLDYLIYHIRQQK